MVYTEYPTYRSSTSYSELGRTGEVRHIEQIKPVVSNYSSTRRLKTCGILVGERADKSYTQ